MGRGVAAGLMRRHGPDSAHNWRRAAWHVDKIGQGASPAQRLVGRPVMSESMINPGTQAAPGLTLPPSILMPADAWPQ